MQNKQCFIKFVYNKKTFSIVKIANTLKKSTIYLVFMV